MKHRRNRKSSPETEFYREIERRMPLGSADYDRLRAAAGFSAEPEPLPVSPAPTPRRPYFRTVTAVAATLALVAMVVVSGVWVADRLRPPRPERPPLGESETGEGTFPETTPFDETAEPDTERETLPAAPETFPERDCETVPAAAPAKVTIGGIIYHKTKTCIAAQDIGDAIEHIDVWRLETVCYAVRNLSSDEGVAIRWGDCYVLYLKDLEADMPPAHQMP